MVVYSFKVAPDDLTGAKKFFGRQGLVPQDMFRRLIRMAASCERCLTLVERGAPISEIQSSFASILADAKETSRLNGLFEATVIRVAEKSNVPRDFILNVLTEAERVDIPRSQIQEAGERAAKKKPIQESGNE